VEHIDKTNKKYNQYKKPYPKWAIDAMEEVLKTPSGPVRWRKSVAIYLNLNPVVFMDEGTPVRAKDNYVRVAQLLKQKRDVQKTKFGEVVAPKSGTVGSGAGMRESMQIPDGVFNFIEMFDKTAFDKENPHQKKNYDKLRRAFPEFVVAEAV
jgi:hypothetical protein